MGLRHTFLFRLLGPQGEAENIQSPVSCWSVDQQGLWLRWRDADIRDDVSRMSRSSNQEWMIKPMGMVHFRGLYISVEASQITKTRCVSATQWEFHVYGLQNLDKNPELKEMRRSKNKTKLTKLNSEIS